METFFTIYFTAVGEVMKTIDEMDIADNTLVIFTSDNGGMLNIGGQEAWMEGHKLNSDLLGFKFDAWEGGHRIPFIARWPDKIPAGTKSDHLISNVDVLATFAAIVNAKLGPKDAKDSYNILQSLTGNGLDQERDNLVISPVLPSHITLRKKQWLYIGEKGNGGFSGKKIGEHTLGGPAAHKLTKQENSEIINNKLREDASLAQLYNLKIDPYQKQNLYEQYPEIVDEMKTLLEQCIQSERTAPSL
jgi:arylsulfatase A-like enzyme